MTALVETSLGWLQGKQRAAHLAFLGVPYAQPPVGRLRFSVPRPAAPWSGVREALRFSKSAMQGMQFVPDDDVAGTQESEDCLYLNVFTRALGPRKRPVLVWIHGGAYTVGSAALPIYDGGPLCELGDAVVVTLNYRLGAFGFLYLGPAGERMDAVPNLGLLDQVAALRWVRANIEALGGDPHNVTIFGESAGATSVCALLTAPSAKGLFQRAIAQSSALEMTLPSHEQAERTTRLLLAKLGLAPAHLEQLRELPASTLSRAQRAIEEEGLTWLGFFPVQHEHSLPQQPRDALRESPVHVPLIVGFNRDEWNLFDAVNVMRWSAPMTRQALHDTLLQRLSIDSQQADRLIDAYAASRREHGLASHEHALLRAILGDHRFGMPSLRFAEAYQERGGTVFSYRFYYGSPALRGALGACHALEIPFVFGTYRVPGQERFAGAGPAVEALSARMMRAWLSFAEHGAPAPASSWPRYRAPERATLIFDLDSRLVHDPLPLERAAWEGIG